jgi:hydrogenase expression/formation protein HypE
VLEEVRGACEILGLDPLYVANEGKLIAFVDARSRPRARRCARTRSAATPPIIGEVVAGPPGRVFQRSRIGGLRVVEMLSGEQLPRIC